MKPIRPSLPSPDPDPFLPMEILPIDLALLPSLTGVPPVFVARTVRPLSPNASAARAGDLPARWKLVVGPRGLNASMLLAIARMGAGGAVRVLDGGNRFNAYPVARAVRGRADVLNRITVSRAFTCYQVLSLLESTPAIQAAPQPDISFRLVALDLLNTFYDEAVRPPERRQLLRACLVQLERLAVNAGAISVHPPAVSSPVAVELLQMLAASPAVETFFVQEELPPPEPLKLF